MLKHENVWAAIDELAARHGYSISGLAKKAGLDSTAFNKSKRISPDGRPRWPSTESVSKILDATGAGIDEFFALLAGPGQKLPVGLRRDRTVPLIGYAQAGEGGYFDDGGYPVGTGWDDIEFPSGADRPTYAIEVQGESMLPLYREGDILIVEPGASVRRGDRVVVKTNSGEVMTKILRRKTVNEIELMSLNREHSDRTLAMQDVDWVARIIWASQ